MAQKYEKIFAALDGGSTQEAVALRAVSLAADNEAQLIFGHVVDSIPYESAGVDYEEICAERKERLEEELSACLSKARDNQSIPRVELMVGIGRITDVLEKKLIDSVEPDLVICGERGLSNIKYAFVGSVSTHLIRTVRCDVLVVKEA